jgi:sRNA-binding regulator protein Hfq
MKTEQSRPNFGKQAAVTSARVHSSYQPGAVSSFRLSAQGQEENPFQRQAELLYLQKQIQTQTPMVLILEDGEKIEGCIEWYDRSTIKVRGRTKILVYKSAIKYMYKLGDAGQ